MQPRSCFGAGLPTVLPSLGLRSVTLFVKGEVGSPPIWTVFLGFPWCLSPGQPQVIRCRACRPPAFPPAAPRLLQPCVPTTSPALCRWEGVPAGKGPQPFLCAAAKALAWYQGGQTKLDPFLSTGPGNTGLPAARGPFSDPRDCPRSLKSFLGGLARQSGKGQGLPQAGGSSLYPDAQSLLWPPLFWGGLVGKGNIPPPSGTLSKIND